jgi:hypothetical protein
MPTQYGPVVPELGPNERCHDQNREEPTENVIAIGGMSFTNPRPMIQPRPKKSRQPK